MRFLGPRATVNIIMQKKEKKKKKDLVGFPFMLGDLRVGRHCC